MIKKILIIAFVTAMVPLMALPLGNPKDPMLYENGLFMNDDCRPDCLKCVNWLNTRFGFYGDYSHQDSWYTDGIAIAGYMDDVNIKTNAGYLVLNACEWIDFFVTLGATDLSVAGMHKYISENLSATMAMVDYRSAFSWSVGGRMTFWQWKGFYCGVEGQFFRSNPYLDSVRLDSNGQIFYFSDRARGKLTEWQVGLGTSYTYAPSTGGVSYTPYIGFYYNGVRINHTDSSVVTTSGTQDVVTMTTFEAQKNWGYAIGITSTICDAMGITVEGRFANESAISVIGELRF